MLFLFFHKNIVIDFLGFEHVSDVSLQSFYARCL